MKNTIGGLGILVSVTACGEKRSALPSTQSPLALERVVLYRNGSSTMVAVLNEAVDAEQTFLYRPGGAGIGAASYSSRDRSASTLAGASWERGFWRR